MLADKDIQTIQGLLQDNNNIIKMNTIFPRFKKVELETAHLLETLLNIKFDPKHIITDDDGKEWMIWRKMLRQFARFMKKQNAT